MKKTQNNFTFNILFIGDLFGSLGRKIVQQQLNILQTKHKIDLTIVNGENATNGCSISKKHFRQLIDLGVDVVTMGNHTFHLKEMFDFINQAKANLLRPLNFPKIFPGFGTTTLNRKNLKIRITNIMGNIYINEKVNNPFVTFSDLLKTNHDDDIHIVDFHGEASAEKATFAWAFDGKVTAVLGTHTHVQTNDARLLPKSTFFITDVGMTGPYNSIIGANPQPIIEAELTGKRKLIRPFKEGPKQLSAVVLNIDVKTKKVIKYKSIYQIFN